MLSKSTGIITLGVLVSLLSACFKPPYNNFKSDQVITRRAIAGTTAGAITGGIAAGTTGAIVGGAAGGTVGVIIGLQKDSRKNLIKELKKQDIQYVQYGDTMTLVVPTDKYYMFNSPRLNEQRSSGLINIVKLLQYYPKSPIYVAAFTDNVGSSYHKRELSQSQAETMMTFLWANNIAAKRLKAEGYSDKNDISDNHLIHGSAQNRRIEIQWFTGLVNMPNQQVAAAMTTK